MCPLLFVEEYHSYTVYSDYRAYGGIIGGDMDAESTLQEPTSTDTPLLERYRETFVADVIAGITGAVAGAPQAMGFAIIAGVSPLYGLYTAFIGTMIGALFSNSRMMTIAPTNALAVVVGSTLLPIDPSDRVEYLFVLTLLVGIYQVAFSVLRLGRLTRFVSNAVMTGFITGAGALIILGQVRHLTGYESDAGGEALARFWDWLIHLPESDPETTVIGITATVMIYFLHHTRFKSLATLIAMIVTSVVIAVVDWHSVPLVEELSKIPASLPDLVVPDFDLVSGLLSTGLALSVLASVQSAALVKSIPDPNEESSSPNKDGDNRDLLGQGIANLASSFFQGMPVGGSLSRTAVNISAGARTRLANVFAGVFVGLTLLLFGNLIEQIALAALAGHLVVAALSLIKLDAIRMVWKVSLTGRISMVVTFLSTLVLPLEYSIYIGVGLSLAMYVYSSSIWLHVTHLVPMGNNQFREDAIPDTLPANQPIILSIYGNLYFAAVRQLEEVLPPADTADHCVVILRLRHNPYMGATGLKFLKQYADELAKHESRLMLIGVGEAIQAQMERTGTIDDFGEENIYYTNKVVFSAAERALVEADRWLTEQISDK